MSKSRKTLIRLAKIGAAVTLVALLLLPLATPARAAEIIEGDPDAHVGPDEVIDDDLFISGRSVLMEGTVRGDVFATGQDVVVNGVVEGNLFIAGQTLTAGGTVEGNIFAGAYAIELGPDAVVEGNVYSGGFSFHAAETSQIERNFYGVGYQGVLDGQVGRNAVFAGGAFQLNGDVGRDLYVEVGESDEGFAESSRYWTFYIPSDVEVLNPGYQIADSAAIGGEDTIRVTQPSGADVQVDVPEGQEILGIAVANWVRTRVGEFLALFIVGALLLYFMRERVEETVLLIKERPLQSLGWGLLTIILFPAAFLLALALLILLGLIGGLVTLGQLVGTIFSLGGVTLGLAWALFGFVLWMASKAIFGYLVGTELFQRVGGSTLDERWGWLVALLVGVLIYEIVRSIPLLGGLIALLVILLGLGAVFQVLRARWEAGRTAAAA